MHLLRFLVIFLKLKLYVFPCSTAISDFSSIFPSCYLCEGQKYGLTCPLRKPAHMIYSNVFRSKIDNFQGKIFDIFLIFAQNMDFGYTLEPPCPGGSNEYPQSMFGEAVLTCTHNLCFGAKIRK